MKIRQANIASEVQKSWFVTTPNDLDKDMKTQGEEISFQKVIFNSTIVSVPESWFMVKLGSR